MTQPAYSTALVLSDGTEVDTWDRYTIALDMLQPGSPWTATMWRSDTRQTTWRVLRSKVKLLDRVMLTINGAPQLNGRIETFATRISRKSATMEIGGRDLAGPA